MEDLKGTGCGALLDLDNGALAPAAALVDVDGVHHLLEDVYCERGVLSLAVFEHGGHGVEDLVAVLLLPFSVNRVANLCFHLL